MKACLAILACCCALMLHTPALAQREPPNKGMSAIELYEALAARDAGRRDRAVAELGLCTEAVALDLGAEVVRGGVREAEIVLRHVARAASANACVVAVASLDSKQQSVRVAAMRALAAATVSHAGDAVGRQMNQRRTQVALEVLQDTSFVQLECEALTTDTTGTIQASVRGAMQLAILIDRIFGAKGTPLLMKRLASLMKGVAAEPATPSTILEQAERIRRAAAVMLEAVMVVSPAANFNYVPNAGFAERSAAAALVEREADTFATRELVIGAGEAKLNVKGLRYGDYLVSLYRDSDISGHRAAAYLRLQWWMSATGPESEQVLVVIEGAGYADSVEKLNTLSRPDRTNLRRKLEGWWSAHRTATEPKQR